MKKVIFGRDLSLKEQKPETPQPTPLNTEQKSNDPIVHQTPNSPSIKDLKDQAKLPESSSKNVTEQMGIENKNREEDIIESTTKRNQEKKIEKGEEVKDTTIEKLQQKKTVSETNKNSNDKPITSKKVIPAVKTTYASKSPNTKKRENEVRAPSNKNTSNIKKTTGPLQKPVPSPTANLSSTNQSMAKQVRPTPRKNISGLGKVSVPQKKVQNTVNNTSPNVAQNKANKEDTSNIKKPNNSQETGTAEDARVRFKEARIPVLKNNADTPSNKEDQIIDAEIEKLVKESVDNYFANHSHGNDKEIYDKHRLPIDITPANGAAIYDWLLKKRKINQEFLNKTDDQIIVLGHATITLYKDFNPKKSKKIISEKTPSQKSKQASSSSESESSSNSSSSSDSDFCSEDDIPYKMEESSGSKTPESSVKKTTKEKQKTGMEENYSFTHDEENLVIKKITEATGKFFAKRSIATSFETYKKYILPLSIPNFSPLKLTNALKAIFNLNPKHIVIEIEKIKEGQEVQQLYVKGYGVVVLGCKTLPEEKIPLSLRKIGGKKINIEKKNGEIDPVTKENQTKITSPADDNPMDMEPTTFLIQPPEPNIGVIPESKLEESASNTATFPSISSNPVVEETEETKPMQAASPPNEKKNFLPYKSGFFSKPEEKEVPSTTEKRPFEETKQPPNTPKRQRLDDNKMKKVKEIQNKITEAIQGIILKKKAIMEACDDLEKFAKNFKDLKICEGWNELINSSKTILPADDFQEKIKDLSLLNAIYKTLKETKEKLDKPIAIANQYMDEQINVNEADLDMQYSDIEEDSETTITFS